MQTSEKKLTEVTKLSQNNLSFFTVIYASRARLPVWPHKVDKVSFTSSLSSLASSRHRLCPLLETTQHGTKLLTYQQKVPPVLHQMDSCQIEVGGYDLCTCADVRAADNIYLAVQHSNQLLEIITSHMPTAQCWCLMTVLCGNNPMVVGIMTGTGHTNKVEIAQCCSYRFHMK